MKSAMKSSVESSVESSKALHVILVCLLSVGLAFLVACASTTGSADVGEAAAEEGAFDDGSLLEIGDLSAEWYFDVVNGTDLTLTALAIKDSQADEYPKGQTLSDLTWETGMTARIHFDPQDAQPDVDEAGATGATDATDAEATTGAEAADTEANSSERTFDVLFKQLFDIELTFADGVKKELHNIDLNTLRDTVIEYADGVAYLSYTDEAGIKTTTLDAEKALAEQSQEQSQEQATGKTGTQSLSTSPYGYSYNNSGSSSGNSSDVQQNSDVCVDDPLFR